MKRLSKGTRFFRMAAVVAVIVCAVVAVPVIHARADKANPIAVTAKKARGPIVEVTLGKGEIVQINGEVSDVLVANPAVADVVALQSNKLYIVGAQLGDTNLMVLDAEGNLLQRLDIHVKLDEMAIEEYLQSIYPNEDVKVRALNDQLILSGTVSSPSVASRVAQIVASYLGEIQDTSGTADDLIVNLLNVTGEQQVMLKVKILEVSKSLIKELGIQSELELRSDPQTIIGAGLGVGAGLTRPAFGLGAILFDDNQFGPLSVLLSAVEQGNLGQVLAEPNLTALSGQEAGFLAGGEFPIPGGRDDEGNVIIEFRTFGVSLNFRPVVISENRISLQLNTEVSSLSRDETVTIAGLDVPGLNIRRASTTVELPSGGGMMIGGLLQSNTVKGMAGLPGIRSVPVIGDLMSSRSFSRNETELIVLVTAYLISPYAANAADMPPADLATAPAAPQDTPVPIEQPKALGNAFADNIRRIYGRKAPDLLDQGGRFGYMIN